MKPSGKRILLVTLPLVALLLLVRQTNASSRVEVRTEGDGEAHVNLDSTFESTTKTITKTSTGRIDIVIECNGVKKEYHSDQPGSVNVECNDNEATINTNQTLQTTPKSPTTKITLNPTEKAELDEEKEEIEKEVEEAKERLEEEQEDFIERIREFLQNLFKNFHF